MNDFQTQHRRLVDQLRITADKEQGEGRRISCEGEIYDLYLNLLNHVHDITVSDVIATLNEIDTLERLIMMGHYFYDPDPFERNYRAEFPCRTSAIIMDIIIEKTGYSIGGRGERYICLSLILPRKELLEPPFFYDYHHKHERLKDALMEKLRRPRIS